MSKKLEIDRLFGTLRENLEPNCFQNVREDFIRIFNEYDVPYIVTSQPKRKFFVGEDLIKDGFVIYYNLKQGGNFKRFKKTVEEKIGGIFELSFNRGDVPNRGFVVVRNKK